MSVRSSRLQELQQQLDQLIVDLVSLARLEEELFPPDLVEASEYLHQARRHMNALSVGRSEELAASVTASPAPTRA